METIGLIAAMPSESDALLRSIRRWKRTRLGPLQGARFHLSDQDCLLVTSGMGLARAAEAARLLLAKSKPYLLVSFGIAGAVNPDLNIGDVVIAEKTCVLNKDTSEGFLPLAALSAAAWDSAAQALQPVGARLVRGTAVTTRGSQVVSERLVALPNPILEMETAGIAQVAAEARIPLLSIRSISDGPRAPIPFNLEGMLDDEYNFRLSKLLLLVLHRPGIMFEFLQMLQNSRKAAENAAQVLVAMLSQPASIKFL